MTAASPQYNAAQAKVSAAKADVDRLQAFQDYKQVTAPFDGVITVRRIDIGDLVTAGSTTNTTLLYSIAQIDVIRVFVEVPQAASSQIVIGMPAQTTSNSFPGRAFAGRVVRTARAIDPQSRTLRVEVDIPNPELILLPGMYVQVRFDLKQDALLEVPASAMLFRTVGPQVAVVGEDGRVSFRNVTIAADNGDVVEIGSGLDADDRVALNLSSQVADGDRVSAVDTEKPVAAASAEGR
jgi:RND family efflux transporter MFP subunit